MFVNEVLFISKLLLDINTDPAAKNDLTQSGDSKDLFMTKKLIYIITLYCLTPINGRSMPIQMG
jgi:hypothetical protein